MGTGSNDAAHELPRTHPVIGQPPGPARVPRRPVTDEDAAMVARIALELGLTEDLVRAWLEAASELGQVKGRRSHGARLGGPG